MIEHWPQILLVLALLNLDTTAAGQFMVSRPVVSGPLIGFLAGEPLLGLKAGALVELIWIGEVAVGAHLPVDLLMLAGAAVVFASDLSALPTPPEAVLTFAIGAAIPLALVSTEAEILLRKVHVRWAHFAQRMAEQGKFGAFDLVNPLVLAGQFLKGLILAGLILLAGPWVVKLYAWVVLAAPRVVEGLYYAHWLLLALGCSAAVDLMVQKKTVPFLVLAVAAVLTAAFFEVPGAYLMSAALLAGFVLTLVFAGKGESA